jgi:hypothetical protein
MRVLAMGLLVLCGVPGLAAAQDQHKVGLTMGYPSSAGILWHVSRRVAVRPEVSFTTTSNEFTSAFDAVSTTTATSVGVGISGIFYLTTADKLRTYVSPRFTYARLTTDTTTRGSNNSSDGTGNNYSAAGSFGAQYAVGDRFTIFGEVGLGYSDQNSSSEVGIFGSTNATRAWSSRTGVGMVLYF